MSYAKKDDWVQISKTVLKAGERAPQVPADTQDCDLKMWVKGFIQEDAEIGDEVEIVTAIGRHVVGELCEVNPKYTHTYGNFVPELVQIQRQVRELTFGGENNE
ncbi:2-amino-4-oxopentanoate thiolase subunit OrtA [Enterococcus sp. DIV0187]|uniref:2-amino-4-oxopentanoate thiolase subunit OrtA n=1 Tax=Enterococcus sp. DIV0187 TaxID=2774644 RepID=UPI003F209BD4